MSKHGMIPLSNNFIKLLSSFQLFLSCRAISWISWIGTELGWRPGEPAMPHFSSIADVVLRISMVLVSADKAQGFHRFCQTLISPGNRQTSLNPPWFILLYLLQMHGDCFTIFNQPGALLHLHFIEKLSIDDRRMTLQANFEAPSLDIHHHILPLQPEVHLERDGQLDQTEVRFEELSSEASPYPLVLLL